MAYSASAHAPGNATGETKLVFGDSPEGTRVAARQRFAEELKAGRIINGVVVFRNFSSPNTVPPSPQERLVRTGPIGIHSHCSQRLKLFSKSLSNPMKRLLLAALIILPFAMHSVSSAAQGRPNIIFIFSDDHAQAAISAYGSKVNKTPNIDRIAAGGARFTNSFVTNSICTPSRATLLTGQYSHLNGVPVFNRFDGSRDTVAKHLQAGGYHTGMIGKWHLGSDPTGFDRWIVLPGQGNYWNPQFLAPGKKMTIKGHCTDITTDLGIEWLKTRPKEKPFFLMLHQKAPHRRWQPAERHIEMFKGKKFPEPDTLFDDYATRPTALPKNKQTIARHLNRSDLKQKPPEGLEGKELVKWQYHRYMQDYLACVQGVDDGVGKVLDYLDTTGLSENTIVIYSADNGWYLGEFGLYDKRFMYEPGLRVPLLARGPGIKAASLPDRFVANIDLAPTFLDLAGLPAPDSMQGRSLVPLLKGESPDDWRTSIYYRYYHDPGHHNTAAHLGVRTATHKLIYYWKQDAYEMFDLTKDPAEQHNLLFDQVEAKQPQIAAKFAELKAEIARLQKEFKDDGQYADPSTWPKGGADGPFKNFEPIGEKSIAEAIAAAAQ
ncbi:MAG: arylsulfatase A-like enzyme [Verrucomicrobiales bacterium]|jgi:arylsulfatase A-like enzyme